MAKASCWSCVTSTAVAPLALMISRTSSDSRSRRSTSRFENGSSSSSSSGRGASARASATRCCWPPESSCGYLSSDGREADQLRQLLHARAALVRGRGVQPEGDVSARPSDAETARSPGTPCRCAASPAAASRPRRTPRGRRGGSRPRCSGSKPAMQRSTVVLPQPLGPSRQPIAPRGQREATGRAPPPARRRRGAGFRLRSEAMRSIIRESFSLEQRMPLIFKDLGVSRAGRRSLVAALLALPIARGGRRAFSAARATPGRTSRARCCRATSATRRCCWSRSPCGVICIGVRVGVARDRVPLSRAARCSSGRCSCRSRCRPT